MSPEWKGPFLPISGPLLLDSCQNWLFLQRHKEPLNLEDVKRNQKAIWKSFGSLPHVEMGKLRTTMEGAMSVVEPGTGGDRGMENQSKVDI